jgi:hypothetical protein
MRARTAFLSKLIGVYCIVVGIVMGLHKQATLDTVVALVHDSAALFVFGLVLVAAGLALVLSHNVWSGGAVPVLVTLVGWLSLLKGLLFLLLPPPAAVGIGVWGTPYAQYFYLDVALSLIIGAYLTYAGFRYRDARA